MPDQPFFFLVSVMDDALMGQWAFRAADELAVMGHLLGDPWSYEDVFWGLRIGLRAIDRVTPEELLQAINDSYGPAKTRTVLYLIRIFPGAICPIVNDATPKLERDRGNFSITLGHAGLESRLQAVFGRKPPEGGTPTHGY